MHSYVVVSLAKGPRTLTVLYTWQCPHCAAYPPHHTTAASNLGADDVEGRDGLAVALVAQHLDLQLGELLRLRRVTGASSRAGMPWVSARSRGPSAHTSWTGRTAPCCTWDTCMCRWGCEGRRALRQRTPWRSAARSSCGAARGRTWAHAAPCGSCGDTPDTRDSRSLREVSRAASAGRAPSAFCVHCGG